MDSQSDIINANFSYLNNKIKEIELYKTPNVLIEGEPSINNGQVTGFSRTNYLIFPFQFDVGERGFEFTYCFRTGADVTTPQNLYGSKFSIASYVSGGKLTVRVSSNGTSWDVLDLVTSLDVQPNTTYYIKLIFNRLNYTVKASTDGVQYSQIGYVINTGVPSKGDVFIGIGNNQNNPFLGMINLHKWELKYNNSVFWEGMDDAGLATRADISLSNLDDEGQAKFNAKQDVIEDLADIRDNATTGAGLAPQVEVNTQRIEDLTVAKFPNVVIVGTPHIEGGQVSNYSDTSYLQFPFVDISRGQPFDIYFSFTTAQDITTQQNILDAHFGIALAVQNGKGVMALSSNGTSWDIGTSVGTNTLLPNTTYYVKYSWTGTEYSAALSTDDQTYVPDMNLASTLSPYKTTIFIGGSPNIFGAGSAHPFKGTINFNKSKVVVNGITVWEGMADVGLASRANVSLNNLDEVGEARFDAKQDTLIAGENITIEDNVISSAGGAVDNKSITKNTDNQIQAVGVIEKNTGAVKYDWIGTLAEYNSQNVETLHPDWICYITDDVSGGTSVYTKTEVDNAISTALTAMLDSAFPVGYRYITEASTCPLATLIPNSTWVLTSQGRVIQGADSNHASGTTAEAGLPEIGGSLGLFATYGAGTASGGFTQRFLGTTGSPNTVSKAGDMEVDFSANRSNPIYGNSTTVQPPAEFVNIFKRIA